jgi:hypothetical protein
MNRSHILLLAINHNEDLPRVAPIFRDSSEFRPSEIIRVVHILIWLEWWNLIALRFLIKRFNNYLLRWALINDLSEFPPFTLLRGRKPEFLLRGCQQILVNQVIIYIFILVELVAVLSHMRRRTYKVVV